MSGFSLIELGWFIAIFTFVLEKLKERFKLKGADAKELLQSLESYCELIIHTMKNE